MNSVNRSSNINSQITRPRLKNRQQDLANQHVTCHVCCSSLSYTVQSDIRGCFRTLSSSSVSSSLQITNRSFRYASCYENGRRVVPMQISMTWCFCVSTVEPSILSCWLGQCTNVVRYVTKFRDKKIQIALSTRHVVNPRDLVFLDGGDAC